MANNSSTIFQNWKFVDSLNTCMALMFYERCTIYMKAAHRFFHKSITLESCMGFDTVLEKLKTRTVAKQVAIEACQACR